jgi:DUF2971 family protein
VEALGNDMASTAPVRAIDIAALTQFLDSLQSYSSDLVQHLQSGQTLCHYTTLGGAYGIITDRDLWLTNSKYSNDDEELNYGHRMVESVLAELKDEAKGNQPRLDWLLELRSQLSAAREDEVYICCFCERENLLSQWRGYADDGGGVSIEFDAQGFGYITGPDNPLGLMRLWKVFYDKAQQRKIVRDAIDYPYSPAATLEARIPYVVDALQFFVPTFKDEGFREEQERRLIFTPHPGIVPKPRFRTRRGLLAPYFSLRELSETSGIVGGLPLPLLSILVGPSPNKALNVDSLSLLLKINGYTGVKVRASPIPYRP